MIHLKSIIIGFFLLLLCMQISNSQPVLRRYDIYCAPDSLNYIHLHHEEELYIQCEFKYEGELYQKAHLRLRGDSSRSYPKKSYKVNFNPDNRFENRDKINLVSEYLDYSFCHEYLSYDLFQRAGLEAARCWFAEVYLNDSYMGLYLDVEQIDEHFLNRTTLSNNSSIYKASLDGSMLRKDEKLDSLWEKKTNEFTGFYDFEELLAWIHSTPSSRFYEELDQVFDREQLARHIALNTLITNSSTYYHNYYLIHDINLGGKWSIVPWDIDRSFRSWGTSYEQPEYYISSHVTMEETNPFIEMCWRDTRMRDLIYQHTIQIADSFITHEYYDPLVSDLDQLLTASVEADIFKRGTTDQFHADLLSRPEAIIRRADHMRDAISSAPRPFNILEIFPLRDGVLVTWNKAEAGDGGVVNYVVRVDDVYTITEPQLYAVGEDSFLVINNLDPGEYYFDVEATNSAGRMTTSMSFFRSFTISENDGTEISGTLTSSSTWRRNNNPYYITTDFNIPENTKLDVEAGVQIIVENQSDIIVGGLLNIKGTITDSVNISGDLSQGTCGKIIVNGNHAELNTEYLKTSYIKTDQNSFIEVQNGSTMQMNHSSLMVESGNALVGDNSIISIANSFVEVKEGKAIDATGGQVDIHNTKLQANNNGPIHTLMYFNSQEAMVSINDTEIRGAYVDTLMKFNGCSEVYIANSWVIDGNIGLTFYDVDDSRIENTIFAKLDTSLIIKSCSKFELFNSVMSKSHMPIVDEDLVSEIRNTIFYGNEIDILESNGELDLSYCLLENDRYPVLGGVYGDPVVTDAWNNNWMPLLNSPLIDAGYGLNFPLVDILRNSRVDVYSIENTGRGNISYVDIGPIEYQGISITPPDKGFDEDLLSIFPNPGEDFFRIKTRLDYSGKLTLVIYNILGRRVYKTRSIQSTPGKHEFFWNGKMGNGMNVASGIYIVVVEGRNIRLENKLVLIK